MGDRIYNQENRECTGSEQNFKTYGNRGGIGDRDSNLTKLIGLERVMRQDFGYEGTFYVTGDGETYDEKYVKDHDPLITGIKFYEVSNWRYNKRKEMYEPIIRRIVMIKIKETQLLLDL